ncbi:hypothetical protein BD770DRAFT_401977 [Pilaira anomala]|nr:hypothetical protein BD770DRAFT_401977 [Pilaira anomala]
MTGDDDRPYRCMIGSCKKAYRTASGFRYHQQNGHQIQSTTQHLLSQPQQQHHVQQQQQQQQQFRMKREKWVMEGV